MWYVFDVTQTEGVTFRTRSRTIAHVVAWFMGARFDYGNATDAGV